MKKSTILMTGALLAILSGVASADVLTDAQLDGSNTTPGQMVVIDTVGYASGSPRTFNPGEPWGNQTATVTIPMSAMIPCKLEMRFTGNDENQTLESWGAGASDTYTSTNNYIAFHPEVGGYLNGWTLIGNSHDNNAEVELGSNTFIRACDTFKTEIWSNMNYKYTVTVAGGALIGGVPTDPAVAKTLPVYMRYMFNSVASSETLGNGGSDITNWSSQPDGAWTEHLFSASASSKELFNGKTAGDLDHSKYNALKETTIYQQFKVPFDRGHAAGHYTGTISFVAATI